MTLLDLLKKIALKEIKINNGRMESKNHIGSTIKSERLKLGMNQGQFAEFLGVAQNTLSYWESGKKQLKIKTLKKVSDKLGISIIEFFPSDKHGDKKQAKLDGLLRCAQNLPEKDLEELADYAEYRFARARMSSMRPNGI